MRPCGQDEIGRLDEQFLGQPGEPLSNELDYLVALRAARNGFGVVGYDLAVRPYEIVAKLGATSRQIV